MNKNHISFEIHQKLQEELKELQKRAKMEVEQAGRNEKKRIQAEYDKMISKCKIYIIINTRGVD